jgi:probable metal-binding protein
MGESIHGHEVMRLIHEAKPALSRFALKAAVERRFGRDATFHVCEGGGMTLDELLLLLKQRGKIVEAAGVLRVDMSQVCDEGQAVVSPEP